MTAPHDRPDSADSNEPDGDQTLDNRPVRPKLDDLYPTLANNPGEINKTERPALYAFLAPPVGTDEIGRLGHFRVIKLLGAGGMGMVFLAEDSALGRQVALKVMKPRDDNQELAGQRFLKEARAIAKIKHDNLITIYQVGQDGATCFYAMELLAGETLDSRVKRVKRWKIAEILRVGLELASGLATMHENGLIHRDIKPANIWLEEKAESGRSKHEKNRVSAGMLPPSAFRVKILDFGLVRDVKDDIALTETGIVLGTPAFMSPEQVRGKKVDARTDLYSFGCILYRLCTGKYPHEADNSMAQLAAVVADEPESVSELNPEIPPVLARLVMQLLSKDPDGRPKSAAVVADRLRQMQQSLAGPGRAMDSGGSSLDLSYNTSELTVQPSFWSRHGRTILLLAGAGLGAAALGVAAVLVVVFAMPVRPVQKKPPAFVFVKDADKGPPPFGKDADKGPPPFGKEVDKAVAKQFLSQMQPVQMVIFKKKDKDKDKEKKPPKEIDERVVVNQEPSPHGIFMHAAPPFDMPASHSYKLDKKFQSFSTKVSLNDSSFGSKEPLLFTVFGDGKELWQSKPVRTQADPQGITLDVKDVSILKLQVTIQGNDVGGAHGAWIEPYLVRRAP